MLMLPAVYASSNMESKKRKDCLCKSILKIRKKGGTEKITKQVPSI